MFDQNAYTEFFKNLTNPQNAFNTFKGFSPNDFGSVTNAMRKTTEALTHMNQTVTDAVQVMMKKNADHAQKNVSEATNFVKNLVQSPNMQTAFELQKNYSQQSLSALIHSLNDMTSTSLKVIENLTSNMAKEANSVVDEMFKTNA
jgi:hypothetical protein